jgi:hypothetical protein
LLFGTKFLQCFRYGKHYAFFFNKQGPAIRRSFYRMKVKDRVYLEFSKQQCSFLLYLEICLTLSRKNFSAEMTVRSSGKEYWLT